MRVLLDTNILCRLAEKGHPQHAAADKAVDKLAVEAHELCLVPQVIYEYWVVVTRPASGKGLGMTTKAAGKAIEMWLDLFTLLRDERGIFPNWHELVLRYEVQGKNAHDARIVAAMRRHGLTHLLTFNTADFNRYSGIELLDPPLVSGLYG